MSAILDLNDIALRLWHEGDSLHSPGYAWFDGKEYRFGMHAAATHRRTPRAVNTRYWSQLGTQPLPSGLGPARHCADLAHSHLQSLHSAAGAPEKILIAAPGSMNREQLSLLLGIVQHLPFEIAGLVHRTGVLGAASGLERGLHVELQLHQIVVTPFESEDGHIVAGPSQSIPGAGLLALQDRLATAISSVFVGQTRFDPLRSADAEQRLYDAMPKILADLKRSGEARVSIDGYEARMTQDDLIDIGRRLAEQLGPLLKSNWPVLIEYPLSELPGLVLDSAVHAIATDALAGLITEHLPALEQSPETLVLRRRVPKSQQAPHAHLLGTLESSQEVTAQLAQPAPRPTHLLQGHTATALGHETSVDGAAVLRFDGDTLTLSGTVAPDLLVNGKPATPGQILAPGDELSDALGFQAQLIVVAS